MNDLLPDALNLVPSDVVLNPRPTVLNILLNSPLFSIVCFSLYFSYLCLLYLLCMSLLDIVFVSSISPPPFFSCCGCHFVSLFHRYLCVVYHYFFSLIFVLFCLLSRFLVVLFHLLYCVIICFIPNIFAALFYLSLPLFFISCITIFLFLSLLLLLFFSLLPLIIFFSGSSSYLLFYIIVFFFSFHFRLSLVSVFGNVIFFFPFFIVLFFFFFVCLFLLIRFVPLDKT